MVQIVVHQLGPKTNQKKIRREKRYSRLADGDGSDLAGTLRLEKKNLQSSGWLCFSAGSNYNRKRLPPHTTRINLEEPGRVTQHNQD